MVQCIMYECGPLAHLYLVLFFHFTEGKAIDTLAKKNRAASAKWQAIQQISVAFENPVLHRIDICSALLVLLRVYTHVLNVCRFKYALVALAGSHMQEKVYITREKAGLCGRSSMANCIPTHWNEQDLYRDRA